MHIFEMSMCQTSRRKVHYKLHHFISSSWEITFLTPTWLGQVKALEHALERETEMNKQNRLRMIKENMFLMNEAKDLREQNRFLAAPLKKGTAKKVAVTELRVRGSLNKASSTIRADSLKGTTTCPQLPELQIGNLEDRVKPQDIGPSTSTTTTTTRSSTSSMRPSSASLRPSSSIRGSTSSGRRM